jgi:mitochondrial FAD-linked sulfhydryl oxidase
LFSFLFSIELMASWQPSQSGDDCGGCDMMQALTKINKNLKTPAKTKKKSSGGGVEELIAKQKELEKKTTTATANAPEESSTNQQTENESSGPELQDPNEGGPLDLNELGNATWGLLHTMAAYYPQHPSLQKQETTKSFLTNLGEVFPCRVCGEDWKNVLETRPPIVTDQEKFSQWLCSAHNDVNERLGKPEFPCQFVNQRWRAQMFVHEEEES